jgi:hypothetical protein
MTTEHDGRPDRKYVFVCGMARSGTSVLSRNVARLEDCTGFKNTGVPEDEGRFLQDVYAIASAYGGWSRFGFDPRAHRTESSDLLTPENIAKLRASWHAHWDDTKSICVEKTPENLLMTRFLQAAFPNSYFIVIRRHPVPVSIASQRWRVNLTSLHRQFEHWLRCHDLFEEDKRFLKHVYELRYEDYVQDPDRFHREIAGFLGTRVSDRSTDARERRVMQGGGNPAGLLVPESAMETTTDSHNRKYFDQWAQLLTHSFFKSYYRYIARLYEERFAKHGYSLVCESGLGVSEDVLGSGERARLTGRLCWIGADAHAFSVRVLMQTKGFVKRRIKALLPEPVLDGIRRRRQRAESNKGKTDRASSSR